MTLTTNEIERFWGKVAFIPFHGCWEWTGSNFTFGHGLFNLQRIPRMAHRISWTLINGAIPEGMNVLHHCDNPNCVNPDHLFLGTQADNIRDMCSKGRNSCGRGQTHYNAKLTDQQVSEIRAINGMTQKQIAAIYGVSREHVRNLRNFKNRKDA